MFERFTVRARQVVVLAQEEARTLKHNWVGTEHILLGLLREEEGIAAYVLDGLGLNVDDVRSGVVAIVGSGTEVLSPGQIPFTRLAKKVLEHALHEALRPGHNYVGPEHILLGLVSEHQSLAVNVMRDVGVGPETVRNEVMHMLAGGRGAGSGPSLGRIGLSDALLDGAGAPLGKLVDQLEERVGRPADAGDLLLVLAAVPEGLSQRALTALGIDLDTLAQAIEQARRGAGRSALLPPPDVLAQCEQVRAERAKLRERERERERELQATLEPIKQRQETFLLDLWERLEHRRWDDAGGPTFRFRS